MGKKIMIVDDAAFMRITLKDILEKGEYVVAAEAANGEDAIQKYSIHKPDAVLMDITMPEMDGLTALKKIIEIDASAKIIMCSAVGKQENVVEAIKAGAKDFVVKPFEANRILEAVKKVLQ